MKVWLLDYDPSFNTTEFVDRELFSEMDKCFRGTKPMVDHWVQREVKMNDEGKPADFLQRTGAALVVSRRAKETIEQLPDLNVEFLPLTSADGEFYILHVLTVLDCVDPKNSLARRFGDGTLSDYEQLAFIEDKVRGVDIFRMKFHEGDIIPTRIYVSDKLKELIESQLEGYQLIESWDSEFPWQQKVALYDSMCEAVDRSLKTTFDFGGAIQYAEKNIGEIAYSGKWAVKSDPDKGILLGTLKLDGTYLWIDPVYYPPIILGLTWGIKKKKKLFFPWLK